MFAVTFRVWCVVVDVIIWEQVGRPLADALVTERDLLIWGGHGVPARIVGRALAWKMSQVERVTFSRFFTDQRVNLVQEQMIGRVRV